MTSDDIKEVRAMEIRFLSNVGKKRNTNQDYADVYYNQVNYPLAILADGMGGHQAGDVASKKAVEELGAAWQASEITDPEKCAQWLIQQIQIENQAIFEMGASAVELAGMGTTIVAVAIFEDQFTIAHVGDSRIYLLRSGKLQQLTEDHSLVNDWSNQEKLPKNKQPIIRVKMSYCAQSVCPVWSKWMLPVFIYSLEIISCFVQMA